MILDTTCSSPTRTRWPKFASLRMDIAKDVEADIIASATSLPFRPNAFKEIYCDPPHFVLPNGFYFERRFSNWFSNRKMHGSRENMMNHMIRFGKWESWEQWQEFLRAVNQEFFKMLFPDGILHFKLCEGKPKDKRFVKLPDLAALSNFSVISTKIRRSQNHNPVYYLIMKPISEIHNQPSRNP